MSAAPERPKKIPELRSALPKPLKRVIPTLTTREVFARKENRIPDTEQRCPPTCQPPRKRARTQTAKTPKPLPTEKPLATVFKAQPLPQAEKKPKRAAWDMKGKLQDATANLQTARQKVADAQQTISQLQNEKKLFEDDLNVKMSELMSSNGRIKMLERNLCAKEQELEELLESKRKFELVMEDRISKLQINLQEKEQRIHHLDETLSASCEESKSKTATIEQLQSLMRKNETLRRQLHNNIQELKGNIRVYCRVRPFLPQDLQTNVTQGHISYPEDNVLQMQKFCDSNLNESTKTIQKYEFKFDRVFNEQSNQLDVFEEVTHLVQSSLDGFNVCLFAYGQTGSGKTYTMEGPSDLLLETENVEVGIIPRALKMIFLKVEELKDKGWQYEMEISAIEIYNESIRDLLLKESCKQRNHSEIQTVEKVTSEEQVYELLKKARKNRAVAATLCNKHSSRSHSVFAIKISGANGFTQERCEGTLNLVDLAGSERLKESQSEGDRLTETKNINRSLSNLKTVIMALAQKKEHIPYRDSKLTFLLRNSLGGNSKTLMLVNVSPRLDHFGETLNSLRFATQVNQCHIGTATKLIK